MQTQVFATTLGEVEGYVTAPGKIIPVDYIAQYDKDVLDSVTDFDTHTMESNGMAASDYYADVIFDVDTLLASKQSDGSLSISMSQKVAPGESVDMDVYPKLGKVDELYVVFFDAGGEPIATGTGTVDVSLVYPSGYSTIAGSVDASAPETPLSVAKTAVKVTTTPNTLSGVDTYRVIVTQQKEV